MIRTNRPSATKAPVRAYRLKIRRLKARLPVRDKRKRKAVLQRIRRAKRGLAVQQAAYRISRSEHLPRKQAIKIARQYTAVKPVRRLKLRQGRQFVREIFAKRSAGTVLKGSYYSLIKPYAENFSDILRTERGRNAIRTDGIVVSGDPAAFILRVQVRIGADSAWITSRIYAIDSDIDVAISELITGINDIETDSISELVAANPGVPKILSVGVQLIYSG